MIDSHKDEQEKKRKIRKVNEELFTPRRSCVASVAIAAVNNSMRA